MKHVKGKLFEPVRFVMPSHMHGIRGVICKLNPLTVRDENGKEYDAKIWQLVPDDEPKKGVIPFKRKDD